MRKPLINLVMLATLVMTANVAFALDFRSAARHGVILYDAPRDSAHKVYVLSRGTPLEMLVEQGDWLRVRDQSGTLAWVKKQDISARRSIQVIKPAEIHRTADAKSPLLFRADTGLLLDLVENTKTGWVKVKHRDGDIGFIRIEEVWGL